MWYEGSHGNKTQSLWPESREQVCIAALAVSITELWKLKGLCQMNPSMLILDLIGAHVFCATAGLLIVGLTYMQMRQKAIFSENFSLDIGSPYWIGQKVL